MGSRRHHPGRHVEDHFARASSTFGPLGEGAQLVSRCKSQEAVQVEGQLSCRVLKSARRRLCPSRHRDQCVELQAAAHAKIERLQVGEISTATCLTADRFDARIHRAGEEEIAAVEEAVLFAVKNRDESLEALAQGEKRLEELQSQQRSPFAGPVDTETELVSPSPSGRSAGISERCRTVTHEGSGDAQSGSSRALSVDGRPSEGFGGSHQHGF